MLVASFFSWWYGAGWLGVMRAFVRHASSLSDTFSIASLLRTLFAPWRRIITYPGASLNAKFHAMLDNLFSRIIGFFVRLFVLLAALLSFVIMALATLAEIIIWPLLPLAIVGFIMMAVTS